MSGPDLHLPWRHRAARLAKLLVLCCVAPSCAQPPQSGIAIRSWELLSEGKDSPTPGPRASSAVFVRDDAVHIYGGFRSERDGSGWVSRKPGDLWRFPLSTRAWTRPEPPDDAPVQVQFPGMVWSGEHLYFGGGRTTGEQGAFTPYPSLWRLDPGSNRWEPLGGSDQALRRMKPWMVWTGDRILMFGGSTTREVRLLDLWEYVAAGWRPIVPANSAPQFDWPKSYIAGAAWTGRELLLLGSSWEGRFDHVWAFEPRSRTWRHLPPPAARPAFRAAPVVAFDGQRRIALFGGYAGGERGGSSSDYFDDLWMFDVERNEWTEIPVRGPRPSRRMLAGGAIHQGMLYVFGGTRQLQPVADLWRIPLP